jgi:exopolyphosphatase/guanosine-5'-triphosphate,3'-diphosphate pyrophosphatase
MLRAAIDVGSNSVLLLIGERRSGNWTIIHEATNVSSLGAETVRTKKLSPEGIDNTLRALKEFFEEAHRRGCNDVRAAATMAARIADNTDEFLRAAEDQDTPLFVLSGDDEALLGFESVASDPEFSHYPRLTIVDVGGQSTELKTASSENSTDWKEHFKKSFSVGTLRLRGGTLHSERPTPEEIMNAVKEIDDAIGLQYGSGEAGQAVSIGATGTNLVSIRERLPEWTPERVHGAYLEYGEISRAAGELMRLSEADRRALVGIERGREGTLPAGALILERFLYAIRVPGCLVSVRGWRYGLLEASPERLKSLRSNHVCPPER